jgi:arylsulfatase A-like enzyme
VGESDSPSILFLVIDSLRADHLGFAGYDRPTSPTLDSLAAEGAAFTACYAQAPHTMPSLPSLMTGRYPTAAIRMASVSLPNTEATLHAVQLGRDVTALPALLRPRGYVSAMINASGQVKYRVLGLQSQFDFVDETVECVTGDCAERINQRAIRWMSQQRSPWFCYIHYMDVHHPYDAPPAYSSRFSSGYGSLPTPRFHGQWKGSWDEPTRQELEHVIGMYDAEVAYLDSQIRRLLVELETRGAKDNLLLVVASDHGDELYERSGFGHGQTLYEEQIRCPLILLWPGRIPAGIRSNHSVQNVDIVPTILDLLGIQRPAALGGRSLVPHLGHAEDPRPVFSERRGSSVRRGRWKLWRHRKELRLYDLYGDPGEEANLVAALPDTVATLSAVLASWESTLVAPQPPPRLPETPVLDSADVGMLRALGYVE